MSSSKWNQSEIILAQEQGAARKTSSMKSHSGTLVLTNTRLLFLRADVWTDWGRSAILNAYGQGPWVKISDVGFAEIYDMREIPPTAFEKHNSDSNGESTAMEMISIKYAEGGKGGLTGHPSLTIELAIPISPQGNHPIKEVFHEEFTGKRRKHINDWADVIMKIKSGEFTEKISLEISKQESSPPIETFEGKVLYILGDMQTKGVFEIETELKKRFEGYGLDVDLDPEKIENACASLIKQGWIIPINEKDLISAYRKRPPLGEEFDLSS